MRTAFLLLAFVATGAMAQSFSKISGKVVDDNGNVVEYATVVALKSKEGVFSDTDGAFVLQAESGDTLLFTHVSYDDVKVAVSDINMNGAVVMPAKTLGEVIVYSGKKKKKKLVGKGMRVPGATTSFTPANIGHEVGSIVETGKPFEVKEISFDVRACRIKDAILGIGIYSLDAENNAFTNIMNRPIYVTIPESDSKQAFTAKPQEQLLLEPGRYYVSVKLIDCDNSAKDAWSESDTWDNAKRYGMSRQSIHFPLYMKGSFIRTGIHEELESIPVNIGLMVKGLEYR